MDKTFMCKKSRIVHFMKINYFCANQANKLTININK